jgi:hypothetical protein
MVMTRHDLPPDVQGILQHAVGSSEENDVLHAELVRRGGLFLLSQRHERSGAHGRILASLVAACQEEIGDLPAVCRPAGHGSCATILWIVGVSRDEEDTGVILDLLCRHAPDVSTTSVS